MLIEILIWLSVKTNRNWNLIGLSVETEADTLMIAYFNLHNTAVIHIFHKGLDVFKTVFIVLNLWKMPLWVAKCWCSCFSSHLQGTLFNLIFLIPKSPNTLLINIILMSKRALGRRICSTKLPDDFRSLSLTEVLLEDILSLLLDIFAILYYETARRGVCYWMLERVLNVMSFSLKPG